MDAEHLAGLGYVSESASLKLVVTNMDLKESAAPKGAVEEVADVNVEVKEGGINKTLGAIKEVQTSVEIENGATNGTYDANIEVETTVNVENGAEPNENGALGEAVKEGGGKRAYAAMEEVGGHGISVGEPEDATIPAEENLPLERNIGIRFGNETTTETGRPALARELESVDTECTGSHAAVDHALGSTNVDKEQANLLVAELVAKCRAPVKSDYLTTAGVRILVPNGTVTGSMFSNGLLNETKEPRVIPEKKSKRQMKRERLLAKKSTEGICAIVAKTGDVHQCPFAENCRFNHDLVGYIAQKPPDLPGSCPSLDLGERCSYGIACRFAGTHKECDKYERFQGRRSNTAPDELNSLSKELQKLLWKNMGSFPKADAQLQSMGLMNKAFKMRNVTGKDSRIQDSGKAEREGAQERSVGVRHDADDATEQSTLETVKSAAVDFKCFKEQGVEEAVGDEGNTGDIAENLCKGPPQSNHALLSGSMECGSPPLKRLKSEVDATMVETHLNDCSSDNFERGGVFDTSTELVVDEHTTLDVPAEDGQAKVKIGRFAANNDDERSLYVESKLGSREKKLIDFRDKLYLAPLTTVGNLPFRRICKGLGADITCGEMAMCTNLLQGQASEWALLRRHSCEDLFGVQICGSFPDHVARAAELIEQECAVDFIDINMGCPIDLVVNKGSGSCLLTKPQKLEQVVRVTSAVMENPLTVKLRMGYYEGRNCAHTLMPNFSEWGVTAVTIHGRTRQQRYGKQADWAYVHQCASAAKGVQVIGNGDVFSYTDWTEHLQNRGSKLSTCMIARGALIKPWLFREIKERRHWDISSGERLDILRQYVHCGLAHWGSDSKGVETTRHFLLEWLSYMHRYIPVGLLEVLPQRLNWRPPSYFGRNDLESLMASESAADWVRITELLLGTTPANFVFNPKHKSNAYDKPENG